MQVPERGAEPVGHHPEQQGTLPEHVGFGRGFQGILPPLEIPLGRLSKMRLLCGEFLLHPLLGLLADLLQQIPEKSGHAEGCGRIGSGFPSEKTGHRRRKLLLARSGGGALCRVEHHRDATRADRLEKRLGKLSGQQQKRSLRGFLKRLQEGIGSLDHESVRVADHRHLARSLFRGAVDCLLQFPDLLDQDAAGLRTRLDRMEVGILLHMNGTGAEEETSHLIGEFPDTRPGPAGDQVGMAEAPLGEGLLE